MRQTLSQLSKTVPKGNVPPSFQKQCLGFWSLSFSFMFILWVVCCLFFYNRQHYPMWDLSFKCFPLPYMHSLDACSWLDCCGTAPGGVAAGSPGSAPAQGAGRRPGGAILTQLVPPGQRDPHGSGRIPQNWVRRKMQTGKVDFLSPHCLSCLHSVSQPQRRWAVIMTSPPVWQDLSGTLGSLRKRTGPKRIAALSNTLQSESVMRVRMGLPRLPGAKRGKKREVALF